MTHITASTDTLAKQAPMTASEYMMKAIEDIDAVFYNGYAQEHPELIGHYIMTCAIDFHAAVIARAIETVATEVEDVANQMYTIASRIEDLAPEGPE